MVLNLDVLEPHLCQYVSLSDLFYFFFFFFKLNFSLSLSLFFISRKNLSLFARWTSAITPKLFVSLDLLNPRLQRIPLYLNLPRSSPAAMYGGGVFLLQTTNSPDPLVSPTRRNLTMFPSHRSLTIRWTDRYMDRCVDRVLFQALARLDRGEDHVII